ncbi:uncharacterized protein LOC107054313 isoform X1 [Gallus gallus]|uniref:uncharacterized protein LOC107054313 isoform X1 n=1 Tax=Gallus gallus TaxID=9031 RepID=UPI001F003D31|nr:uncharacterized protein LOC107054313 isoform X1 [Gallus gallus]XP_046781712.1 uncharacterized protein LOC107054313 isoform X1 [Gallus gallus]
MENTFISGSREENFQRSTLKCSAVQRASFIYWHPSLKPLGSESATVRAEPSQAEQCGAEEALQTLEVSLRHCPPLVVVFAALSFSIAFGSARQPEWIAGPRITVHASKMLPQLRFILELWWSGTTALPVLSDRCSLTQSQANCATDRTVYLTPECSSDETGHGNNDI